jgi:tetratricopeptide (TPR) repeat protein
MTAPRQKILRIAFAFLGVVSFLGFSIAPIVRAFWSESPTAQVQAPTGEVQNRLQERIAGYETVLQREPENVTALRGLADLNLELGKFDQAVEPLTKLVTLQPESLPDKLLLARLKLQLGDSQGAATLFRELYDKAPDNPLFRQGLVDAEIKSGRPEQALQLIEEKLKEDPNDVDLKMAQAMVYAQTSRTEKALTIYDELIAQDKTDFSPLLGKAVTLAVTADTEDTRSSAKQLFEEALRLAPPAEKPQIQQIMNNLYAQLSTPMPEVKSEDPKTPPPPEASVSPSPPVQNQ